VKKLNKIKDLWEKNKVLIVLGVILIICIIAIISVTLSYFFGSSSSVYGSRLDDIENYPITDEFKNEIISSLKENESVESVTIDVLVRTIYINITFKEDTTLTEAQSRAASSLLTISEDYQNYYDISYIIKVPDSDTTTGFTHIGAKNSVGSGLVWDNNTPVEEDE
jgi:hypothetical protein